MRRLSSRFPSYRTARSSYQNENAHVNNVQLQRPISSRKASSRKRRRNPNPGKRGRPSSTSIVYRDLVIIQNQDTKKARVPLKGTN